MSKPRFVLSNMELDEISTVEVGDNPEADILIWKGMPDARSVHHDAPLDVMDFRHAKRMKRRRKKDKDEMRKRAMAALDAMSDEEDDEEERKRGRRRIR